MLHDRIKSVRLAQKPKLSQSDFGAKIGVSGAAISRLESGDRTITEQNIKSICREFNVNETWLRTGEGKMFASRGRSDAIAQEVNRFMADHPDSFRERLISLLIRLDEKQWEVLEQYARQLVDDHDREPSIEERVEAYRQELLAEEKGAYGSSPSPPAANA